MQGTRKGKTDPEYTGSEMAFFPAVVWSREIRRQRRALGAPAVRLSACRSQSRFCCWGCSLPRRFSPASRTQIFQGQPLFPLFSDHRTRNVHLRVRRLLFTIHRIFALTL